jgi:hypothetical protein
VRRRVGYCLFLFLLIGQSQAQLILLKVKIEATELDKSVLVKKLNEHGIDHRLGFQPVDTGYAYRIVFATSQDKSDVFVWGSGGGMNSSAAGADVFDVEGRELFKFTRNGRGTDAGATNAVAKELVKRLVQWRKIQQH